MKPVDQTIFGKPDGNCFAACVASIMEVGLDDLPPLHQIRDEWYKNLTEWLEGYGMSYAEFPLETTPLPVAWGNSKQMMVFVGDGPRGVAHAVVGQGGKLLHDPHPSQDGLLNVKWVGVFCFLDPSKVLKTPLRRPR